MAAVALPFAQFDAIQKTSKYGAKIAAALDWVLAHSFEPDGSLRLHDDAKLRT